MKHRSLPALLVVCCLAPGLTVADDGVFDSNGVKIRYVTAGTGEPRAPDLARILILPGDKVPEIS